MDEAVVPAPPSGPNRRAEVEPLTTWASSPAEVLAVVETMPTAFVCFDRGWRITYANAETTRLVGLSREQMLGHNHWELFPAAVGNEVERAVPPRRGHRPGGHFRDLLPGAVERLV